MDSMNLLRRAYFSLINEVASLQARIVQCEQLRERFGDHALPPDPIYRGHTDTMKNAPKLMSSIIGQATTRLDRLYEQIEEMEQIFGLSDQRNAEAMAKAIISRRDEEEDDEEPTPKRKAQKSKRKGNLKLAAKKSR